MILTKYLTKEVFKSQLAILFILLLIFFCQQLVRVLGAAANGNVPADLVFSLLSLGMPTMAQLMLPLCLFIAVLLTLGRLYAESEITVMLACGVSSHILVRIVLGLSLITGTMAAYNAFWLSPWSIDYQTQILEEAKSNPRMSILSEGQFLTSNNGDFVLFINSINKNQISDVYLFQTKQRGNTKPSVVVAEKGKLESLPNGDQILSLTNSQRFEGSAMLPDFRITHFDEYKAYLGYKNVDAESDKTAGLRLSELWKDHSLPAKAEWQWRLTLILAVPLMALIAVPLSKVNPRQGRFAKILPALLLYLIYFLLQSSLKSAGIAGKLDASIFMPLVNITFLLLAVLLNSWDSQFMYKLRYRLSRKG